MKDHWDNVGIVGEPQEITRGQKIKITRDAVLDLLRDSRTSSDPVYSRQCNEAAVNLAINAAIELECDPTRFGIEPNAVRVYS